MKTLFDNIDIEPEIIKKPTTGNSTIVRDYDYDTKSKKELNLNNFWWSEHENDEDFDKWLDKICVPAPKNKKN